MGTIIKKLSFFWKKITRCSLIFVSNNYLNNLNFIYNRLFLIIAAKIISMNKMALVQEKIEDEIQEEIYVGNSMYIKVI